jgi:hypothetical protein
MTKVHISLLGLIFLCGFFYQPNWVYENFWSKADFYDSLPFAVPFLVFLTVYASISTAISELGIRFVKRYA